MSIFFGIVITPCRRILPNISFSHKIAGIHGARLMANGRQVVDCGVSKKRSYLINLIRLRGAAELVKLVSEIGAIKDEITKVMATKK